MFTIAKKEIVTNQNVVRITVNTGIPLSTNYYSAEKAITKMLTSNYNVYSGNNYEQLVAAWIALHSAENWSASIKCTEEYAWLQKLPPQKSSVLGGIEIIWANAVTKSWWFAYTVLETNPLFAKL